MMRGGEAEAGEETNEPKRVGPEIVRVGNRGIGGRGPEYQTLRAYGPTPNQALAFRLSHIPTS